ncbi:MAG: hypothetical protein WD226_04510 [Planctomycetota bacterium]
MLLISLALTVLTAFPAQAGGQPPVLPPGAADDYFQKPYRVGYPVFEPVALATLAGEARSVLKEAEKQPVVLIFWSLRDPIAHKYRARLEQLADRYLGRVRFHLVAAHHNEIGGHAEDPLKAIKGYVEQEKPQLEILIDERNRIADDFRVLSANHAFVIGADGFLRYAGGIDNDPHEKRKPETRTNYLELALEALLEQQPVPHPLTRPQGLRLVRHPDSPPRSNEHGSAPKPKPPTGG